MGYGSYSHEAHESITRSRSSAPTAEVFRNRKLHPLMDPKGVRVRESRDSPQHPESMPVVFALDVTGSMGDIPELLAKRHLPAFMSTLMNMGVGDPQLMFVGVGDQFSDQSPLQVGQFESEEQCMDTWLTGLHLERGGGGSGEESYETALYWLGRHTVLDSLEKRGKKGYLFVTGDERPYRALSRRCVQACLGEGYDLGADYDVAEEVTVVAAVRQAAAKYHVFFLIPDESRRTARGAERAWRDLLGDHCVCLESPDDVCAASAALVALTEGLLPDVDAVARQLTGMGLERERVAAVVRAVTPYAATLAKDGVPAPRLLPYDARP